MQPRSPTRTSSASISCRALLSGPKTSSASARQELRKHLERLVAPAHLPHLFVELEAIPRNHTGKIDHESLKSRAMNTITKAG
ncbi:acyl-coenzyme A synthetase/AMP-(fatty) acid ligase [Bradyrhizobium diazoefficiens]